MLEHGSEHGTPGAQHSLVALDALPLTLDGDVSQGPGLQQALHVAYQVLTPILLLPTGVLCILVSVADAETR